MNTVTSFLVWGMRAIACLAPSKLALSPLTSKSVDIKISWHQISRFLGILSRLYYDRGVCDRCLSLPMRCFSVLRQCLTGSLVLFYAAMVWSTHPAIVSASRLTERLANFPHWDGKPPVESVEGDLIYPDWLAGAWTMTSTLVEMVAPLAPDVTTPGFDGNRQFLQKPIRCAVRFVPSSTLRGSGFPLPLLSLPTRSLTKAEVVSDRAFNGLNLAKAYLGDRVFRVWTDARDHNRLITKFRDNRKLFSTAIGRATEQPDVNHFIATELFQQFFQSPEKPYKNQVETTTEYVLNSNGTIFADQMTAVYLNPPHPKAFLAGDRPVALYRYRLEFVKG
ncbi:MAG: hypothetical protein NW220_01595 [Leptolyngbyaceae cyanobacterium bins.349]|nr:hypothetical protein [Leptolyngbyaceae cyanobacterium bins.349]